MWKKENFLGQKEMVITHFRKTGVTESNISEYCVLVGIPITVACEFIKEEFPEHIALCDKKIAEINEFFGIKDE